MRSRAASSGTQYSPRCAIVLGPRTCNYYLRLLLMTGPCTTPFRIANGRASAPRPLSIATKTHYLAGLTNWIHLD